MKDQLTKPSTAVTDEAREDSLGVTIKRVLFLAFRYWYFIALSLLVALVVAFLNNRYSQPIYPVTASVIVREAGDISGAELLYNNPLITYKRNYLNEIYVLKSYPLMQTVIEDLNFDITFLREGSILTTEAYNDFPISARAARHKSLTGCRFTLTVLNNEQFRLETTENSKQSLDGKVFSFRDSVDFGGFRGKINVEDTAGLKNLFNEPVIFTYFPPRQVAGYYVKALKADWAEEGAGVINLSINSPNVRKATDFLSGLISRYQESDLEKKNQTASRTVQFISNQLDGITDSLRNVEQQLQRFKDKNVTTDLTGETQRLFQKIEGIETERAKILVSKNYYQYLINYIRQNQNLDQIILPTSVGIADPILASLITKMTDLQLEVKFATKRENPLVQDATALITQLKRDIVESVKNQESTDNIKLDFLNKQIKDLERQLDHLPLAERTLVSIQRNYTLLENLYMFLLQKRSEAAISQASNISDIILVNPPIAGAAISPKTAINYMIALSLGLTLPILLFTLLELLDNRVQSREDIETITSIPFIGGIGHKRIDSNLEVFTKPRTAIAEAFRAMRSNLNYFIGTKQNAVFLISSSISNEGKTFTSINLASVYALSGKRTLIVGADMRKPKLFNDFGLNNTVGLSSFLAGLKDFNEVIQKTEYANLSLVSGGPIPPNPSELLLTNRLKEFIDEARRQFDYVIIDTPPLAIVTDAFVMAPFADHTIFLVRQNYTPKDLLKAAEDYYKTGKLTNISIVLNDIKRTGSGYGYNGSYSYGYGYGGYGDYGYYDEKP